MPQRMPGSEQARFLRDIGESAVAIVVKQNVLAPVGDEDIVEAVVIVVGDGDAVGPPAARETGFFGHIGEGAVAIVLV